MNLDFDVNTTTSDGVIETTIDLIMDAVIIQTQKAIMDTKQKQVREALIKLGWRPPSMILLRD